MSLEIRSCLERTYIRGRENKTLQTICISFSNQSEVRRDFDIFCNKKGITNAYRIDLTPNDYYYPLAPIIYIIKELMKNNKLTINDFYESLNLAPFEKSILSETLDKPNLLELYYLPTDVIYVKQRLVQHLKSIFLHLVSLKNGDPLLICITNLQFAGSSSFDAFLKFVQTDVSFKKNTTNLNNQNFNIEIDTSNKLGLLSNPNVILLLSFANDVISSDCPTKDWVSYEEDFGQISNLLHPRDYDRPTDDEYNWNKLPYQYSKPISIDEIIQSGNLLVHYFCTKEAIFLIKNSLKNISNQGIAVSDPKEIQLYKILGRAYLYNTNTEEALLAFDNMYEKAQYLNRTEDSCKAYIELSYAHLFRSDQESALHFAEMASHLGDLIINLKLVTISQFCLFVAYDKESFKFGFNKLNSLISNLEKFNLIKEMTFVLRNTFAQVPLDENITYQTALTYCSRAITLANRFNIKNELAAATLCKGIVLLHLNQIENAQIAYRSSENYYKQISLHQDLTHVYNSMGFLQFESEEYVQAHENYLKSLHSSIKACDYSEIAITLYNLAELYNFCGMNYYSLQTLNILNKVMVIRNTKSMPFHNLHHILLNKALAYIKNGDKDGVVYADEMLKRSSEYNNELKLNDSELFLFSCINTLIVAKSKKNLDLPLSELNKLFIKNQANLPLKLIMLYFKIVLEINVRRNHYEDAYNTFKKGYIFAKQHNLQHSKAMLIAIMNNKIDDAYKFTDSIKPPVDELDQIITLVEQERKVNILWREVHEMRLISMLHNYGISVKNNESLCKETIRLICSHFNVNGGLVLLINNDNTSELPITIICEQLYKRGGSKISYPLHAHFIHEHLQNCYQECTDEKIGAYKFNKIMFFPLQDQNTMFGQMILYTSDSNDKNSNSNDYEVLTFISQQLATQMLTIIQRKTLVRISTTDMLTGLYNRAEFSNLLTGIIQDLSPSQNIALGFLDLDNFKYYNDNLGHDIGDKLLVWFAQLLNENKIIGDIACRWGGDEFLLLMNNCSAEDAENRMQHILDTLKSKNGYKEQIEKLLGHEINNLPEKYYLSCSIGIIDSSSLSRPFTEEDLLTHADAALYEVKRTGKGRVLNFEKMTHETDSQIMESNR
ncbi:MAG: GGDEF domain-containing protein [Succinivibrionaceae bacterium]